jgi:(1->4)-alpha-D-glucan 1-alpha-D-glucosylmutase
MTTSPAPTAAEAERPAERLLAAQRALAGEHRATYRLQLGADLDFDGAAALAPYLDDLGVSDAYLSPSFRAGPKSSHGYDVVDHGALSPELGGAAGFDRLAAALAARGLGVLLDVVPNHMGIVGDANPWWLDVLENGPSSPYATYFDIDWAPPKAELRDKVLLPVLPEQFGRVLEAQQLELELVEGALAIRYAGARVPLDPGSYARVLAHRIDALAERLPDAHPQMQDLRSILTAVEHLPGQTETDPARVAERMREKEVIKRRLAGLVKESPEVAEHLEETVRAFNGTRGDPRSFDLLDALLSAQAFRLADWRVAGDEVNYRRFFDVNHLAAIRMESPAVFEATHALVLRLIGEGKVAGLRVDHPDGLHAPGEYFRWLQEGALLQVARRLDPELSDAGAAALLEHYRAVAEAHLTERGAPAGCWEDPRRRRAPPRLVARRRDHRLRLPGPVNGSDRAAARAITATHRRFVGRPTMADSSTTPNGW